MIEVRIIHGSFVVTGGTCEKGNLLPKIAELLQELEAKRGDLVQGSKYAIEFWCAR